MEASCKNAVSMKAKIKQVSSKNQASKFQGCTKYRRQRGKQANSRILGTEEVRKLANSRRARK